MLDKIKKEWYLWLAIILLAILLLNKCEGSSTGDVGVTTLDSIVYVKGKPDTVYFTKSYNIYKTLPSKVDTIRDTIDGKEVITSHYTSNLDDSLITGKLTTVIEGGTLKYTDFSYAPKFPKYITKVDTVKEYKTTVVTSNKPSLYVGALVGGSATSFMLAPGLSVKVKNLIVSTNYDLVNKQVLIGVNTKIKNPFAKSK